MKTELDFQAWNELPLSMVLTEAWRVRRLHHEHTVVFATPGAKFYENEYYCNAKNRFVNISITGNQCALNCKHCGKQLLESMLHCTTPSQLMAAGKELAASGTIGVLISGGADKDGAVPLEPFFEALSFLKSLGLKVLVHSGLASDHTIKMLKQAGVDQVLVDVIGDNATIKEVCNLKHKTVNDYYAVLESCDKHAIAVAPHLIIGLHFGELRGELEALRMISAVQPPCVVIVALKSLPGAPMRTVTPPPPDLCGRITALARISNPQAYLSLGCARPSGYFSSIIEQFALNAGVNAIAYPNVDTIGLAREMGLTTCFYDTCCTLVPKSCDEECDDDL